MSTPLVEAIDVRKYFRIREGLMGYGSAAVRAVDGINLTIDRGQVLGLVGESGSGKSTLGRTFLMLEQPTGGDINFDGQCISNLSQKEMRPYRKRMQMVFQDPFSSLNPRMTIEDTLAMPLRFHATDLDTRGRHEKVQEMMEVVGLSQAMMARYPHEFSGGQRQRIGIARALMVEPEFIVADEPVSALDVSVQAQVLNLFSDIKNQLGLTLLFISHDLAVVGHLADLVAVMYLGNIVEIAPTRDLFTAPRHPYTEALMSAVPLPVPGSRRDRISLVGETPSPINPPSGCVFRTRCRYAKAECAQNRPAQKLVSADHSVACIRDDLSLTPAIASASTMEFAK